MKSKAQINYWIDVIIGIAFVLSILSGLVLLFLPSGGYQGGRNAFYGREVLFLGHGAWVDLHNWSSIAMAAGVLGHLILHWNWITCMTKKLFRPRARAKTKVDDAACSNPTT